MAWGSSSSNQDLIDKIKKNISTSMYILPMRKISTDQAIALAEALESNTSMTEFYASGHNFGHRGILAFAEMLKVNQTLEKLCIVCQDESLAYLIQGLTDNVDNRIQHLDLENRALTSRGMSSLCQYLATGHCKITHLNLSRNCLNDTSILELAKAIESNTRLEWLNLAENHFLGHDRSLTQLVSSLNGKHVALNLSHNDLSRLDGSSGFFTASWAKLDLSHCGLTDAFLGPSSPETPLPNATSSDLNLSQNSFTGTGFRNWVAHNRLLLRSMKRLNLSGNQLADEDVLELVQVWLDDENILKQQRASLDLSKNRLTVKSMVALMQLSMLDELCLFDNQLGAGVMELLTNLCENTTLRVLDLGANELEAVHCCGLFDRLAQCPGILTTLILGGNQLGSAGQQALEKLQAARPELDIAVDKVDERYAAENEQQQQQALERQDRAIRS